MPVQLIVYFLKCKNPDTSVHPDSPLQMAAGHGGCLLSRVKLGVMPLLSYELLFKVSDNWVIVFLEQGCSVVWSWLNDTFFSCSASSRLYSVIFPM